MPRNSAVDVVIAGAGPAGSVTALLLARAGMSVTLVERAHFPRRKVCGEYLNCGAVAILSEIGCLAAISPLAQSLRGVNLHAGNTLLSLDFPGPALGIPRAVLDASLRDAAVREGVCFVQGRVVDVLRNGREICGVRSAGDDGDREIRAAMTVGADGCGSIIARKIGVATAPTARARYAMGGHFPSAAHDRLAMHVGAGGYLAINPLGAGQSNIMLVMPKHVFAQCGKDADAWFATTARAMCSGDGSGDGRSKYADDSDDGSHGYTAFSAARRIGERVSIGPLVHRVSRTYARGALLVGDAAGFISPFTGQGVFIALRSALAAAQTILALRDSPAQALRYYAKYDRAQRADRQARAVLSALLDNVGALPAVARRVMHHVERDEGARTRLLAMFCGLTRPSIARGAQSLVPFLRPW